MEENKSIGPKTLQLIAVIRQIITLLEEDNQSHWLKWMQECLIQIESSEFGGITGLLGAYGGMGSFNDLVICQREQNGKSYWRDGYKEKNVCLAQLRVEAYELASDIKREHMRSSN